MEIPLVCYFNAFFMTCSHISPRSGLFIQTAVHWTTGNFLKLVAFICILPILKCNLLLWLLLAWHLSSISQTNKTEVTIKFFTSFKAGIEILPPEVAESSVLQISQELQPATQPLFLQRKSNKSQESNSGFKLTSWDICSTFRSFIFFKCCLCHSWPLCSGFQKFGLC